MTIIHSTRIYNEWVSLHSEGFMLTNLHQDLWILTAKHDILYVNSRKVQEHSITCTTSPAVGRLITPLWNGSMSKKATKSTACDLSKGLYWEVCLMMWGKSFLFPSARGNNNGLFVNFLTTCIIGFNGRFLHDSLLWILNYAKCRYESFLHSKLLWNGFFSQKITCTLISLCFY